MSKFSHLLVCAVALVLLLGMPSCKYVSQLGVGSSKGLEAMPADAAIGSRIVATPDTPIPTTILQYGEDVVQLALVIRKPVSKNPYSSSLETLTLEAALNCGSGGLSPEMVAKQREALGVEISVRAAADYHVVTVSCLERYFLQAWDMLIEALFFPDFDPTAYKQLRHDYAAQIQTLGESDAFLTTYAALQALAGKAHPYATHPEGTYAQVADMPLDSVLACHPTLFTKSRLQLLVVGDLNVELLNSRLAEGLADLPDGGKLGSYPSFEWEAQKVIIDEIADYEGCVVTGFLPAPAIKHNDAPAYILAMEALHQRLRNQLCHQRFLTCQLFAAYVPGALPFGQFGFSGKQTYAAVKACANQLQQVLLGGFTEDELETARVQYLTRTFTDLESGAGMLNWLLAGVGADQHLELSLVPDKIISVDLVTMNKVFAKYATQVTWHYYGQPKQVNARAFRLGR